MFRSLAACLVLVSTGAAAQDAAPAKKEKLICRRDDTVGTRLAPRVCRTKAQWNAIEGDNRQYLRDMADRNEREGFENSPYSRPQ